jgi:hypothetical protein
MARIASSPAFEIVPRDGAVSRAGPGRREMSVEVQLGHRLQKLFTPCEKEPEDFRRIITALDRKLRAR